MPVYDGAGSMLSSVYDGSGNELQYAYDGAGNIIYTSGPSWDDEITVEQLRNEAAATNYYVITIPQTRTDGSKQYPFVFVPNGSSGGTMSTLTMMRTYGFYFGMNGGYFDYAQTYTNRPYGITIENSTIIREDDSYFNSNYTLKIDENGKLGFAYPMDTGVTAQDVLESGAVSAICGLVPLVVEGQPANVPSPWWTSSDRAQRQIIGQKANGDYVIVTCEGRGFDNSQGFTVSEARSLCVSMGLDFAMAVDGGGSTETVIGDEQINTIYEGTTGRVVPTYIVFNGTDTFIV